MFKKKRQNADVVVGLELDPGHIAAAEVHVDGSLTLTRGAVAELRPASSATARSPTPSPWRRRCKALFAENELPKRVRLGIAHQRIVVRTLDLAAVIEDAKALAAAVKRRRRPITSRCRWTRRSWTSSRSASSATPLGPRTRVVVVAVRKRDGRARSPPPPGRRPARSRASTSPRSAWSARSPPSTRAPSCTSTSPGLTNVAVANASGCLFTRAAAGGARGDRDGARRAARR